MMEGGVGNRNLRQYFAHTTLKCLREEENRIFPVGMGDVLSLHAILLFGIILSLCLLAVEALFSEKVVGMKLLFP